jgi:hypothetical protein
MSFPENREGRNVNDVKNMYKRVFNNLQTSFNRNLDDYRRVSTLNDKTTKALSSTQQLLRNVSFRSGELSNEITDQIGIIDTKNRKLELVEEDISLNQNIIKTLYILLIGVAISIVIILISVVMKWGNGSNSVSTVSSMSSNDSGSLFDNIGNTFSSLFKKNDAPTYKGNLFSNDGSTTGNLYKMGGNKK